MSSANTERTERTAPSSPEAVVESVDVAASPDRVFRALIDARELAAWWGSEDTWRTRDWSVDARPGGAWRATTVDERGREGSIAGEYRVVDAPRVLETTWRASWDDAASIVRWELTPVEVDGAPGTRLTVIHTGPAGHTGTTACLAYARTIGTRRTWDAPRTVEYPLPTRRSRAPRVVAASRHSASLPAPDVTCR